MRRWKIALLGSLVAAASFNALACFTVYDTTGRVIYNGTEAPVDMSRPLHETMPQRYPGGHLVFDTVTDCPNVSLVSSRQLRRNEGALDSPLLTDARTAERMNVPHVMMASNIALIPAHEVGMKPAVSIIPASPAATAVAARSVPAREVVITELRDGRVVDTRVMGASPAPR